MKSSCVILVLIVAAAIAALARGGHEFPVYASYYPHQIRIESIAPEQAAALLQQHKIQGYPLGVGSYDAYAIPRRGLVTHIELQSTGLKLSAEIETIMKFQRSYEIHREALQAVDPDIVKRSAPECRYAIVDIAGSLVLTGVLHPTDDATFDLDWTGRLAPGRYTVLAEIVVNGNAMNADIQRIPVTVGANP